MKMIRSIGIALILLLLPVLAVGEGLLPELGDVYGEAMPSLRAILFRPADTINKLEDGSQENIFFDVSEEDFDLFSVYLDEYGCTLADIAVDGNAVSASIEKNGHYISFRYDYSDKTAVIVYPAGTYEDVEAAKVCFEVGRTVTLGTYAGEPIEWIVLAEDGDDRLLIAKYGIEAKAYNATNTSVTWETCSLRAWLNGEFYESAFTEDEKNLIAQTTVKNNDNPKYGTKGGNDTQDYVYLLSIDEVNRYFAIGDARVCYPTSHAGESGVSTNSAGAGWWWLRSPGCSSNYAARVRNDGSVLDLGCDVNFARGCVRPVVVARLSNF